MELLQLCYSWEFLIVKILFRFVLNVRQKKISILVRTIWG